MNLCYVHFYVCYPENIKYPYIINIYRKFWTELGGGPREVFFVDFEHQNPPSMIFQYVYIMVRIYLNY